MKFAEVDIPSHGQDAFTFRVLHDYPAPKEEKGWRDFLSRADWPSHYSSPEFFGESFWAGKRPFAVLALNGDRVVGVLTGLRGGNFVISGLPSRPQVCLDPEADVCRASQALGRGLLAESDSAGLVTFFAWSPLQALENTGFRLRALEGNVVLDLTQGPEALFRQAHENRRRNIRHAIRQGVEIFQASTEEDFSAYYEVYRRWRDTARKKIEGQEIPSAVLAEAYRLRGNRTLFLARHSGKIIAGTTVRHAPGGLLEYAGNSSMDENIDLRPNDLLMWKTIEWGCSQGFRRYSLGGAHAFLRKSGGTILPIYRHRLDRTWLRRHDLLEAMAETGRTNLRRVPAIDRTLRRLLGKS
jgi:GNAT acetyltransferase-like protein